ncbi:hypothetical protein KAFR_0G02660 [Kazachstania africana CBS 2517]|uniref:HRDC domain-containing protein n=1 Tax=Kazachstania africana (strain ATCC 22294 / BCRC 22015 / CBS 2517 / CECT 1963 / NBRC 1671 / NRRL Y-8276) TaxID=1071382 RepID=H2AY47_KAZAF|nr:hypothetical protein KAFR_0G02660 [Kazachstania africana CBS 2517]CCF59297.1 hypothetical protein KAFR_0G02660 [Kazachstania africana CBS 2517]
MLLEEQKKLLSDVVNTVRASSTLAAQDVDFYRSLDSEVSHSINEVTDELNDMVNSIILSIDENYETLDEGKEELTESWKSLSNIVDNLFEKSDRSLDILKTGAKKKPTNPPFEYFENATTTENIPQKRINKPQLKFVPPIDNSESHPFIPLLKEKPNALKTIDESTKLINSDENVPEHYAHPYEYEIDNQPYNDSILQVREPIPSKSWSETEGVWVDNVESLNHMLNDIKKYTEIAIDLEHHDYRTYYGIVCLMQISTRETDYLVDTIALRNDLKVLNEVFTDPSVVKVLHGAFMDIIWLQRDLGLYIVSLFDTFHASRALGFPRHSLAYLLEEFANFKTSKKYQLADWRVRPLSKAMTAYARADTHFLLNIYDQLRNRLVETNKLVGVLNESRNVAKRRFEYSKFRPRVPSPNVYSALEKEDPWRTLMFQYNIPSEREDLLKGLFEWRDMIARRDDESPRYIMPNQLMVTLVAYTPTDPAGVISASQVVTDYVRSNSKIIANLIKNALTRAKDQNRQLQFVADNHTRESYRSTDKMTVSQIKETASVFIQIAEKLGTCNNDQQQSKSFARSNYFGSLSKKLDIIEYKNGEKHSVKQQQLVSRFNTYTKQVNELTNVRYELPVHKEPPQLQKDDVEEVKKTIIADSIPAKPEIDLDEVVVLKKVNRQPNKTKLEENEKIDFIDYSKSEKILKGDKQRKKRESKKRQFDPFAASNEGPKAARKRKSGTRGRNLSYK